jgi:hypothetical protein
MIAGSKPGGTVQGHSVSGRAADLPDRQRRRDGFMASLATGLY